jgi:peroxiredoxin
MSLQDKLDALRKQFGVATRSDALIAILRAVENVVTANHASQALKAGARAPSFFLEGQRNVTVALADLLSRGPVVLLFYRGAWCPQCNLELQAIEDAAETVARLGASIVAISPQTSEQSQKVSKRYGLSFQILKDAGGRVATEYGLNWTVPEEIRKLYLGLGIDLAKFNGDARWSVPLPARYVIGRDQMIEYAEINANDEQRLNPTDLFPALENQERRAKPRGPSAGGDVRHKHRNGIA